MAGKEKADDKLRNKLVPVGKLHDILECPVCLEVVKIPFKLCKRGHLVCQGCAEPLPHCPNCRSKFLLENPVCMKNLLEWLPRTCRHNVNGCKEIVEPESDQHERYCEYRLVKCEWCSKDKRAGQLRQHLEQYHAKKILHKRNISKFILEDFEGSTGTYDIPVFV